MSRKRPGRTGPNIVGEIRERDMALRAELAHAERDYFALPDETREQTAATPQFHRLTKALHALFPRLLP